MTRVMQSVVGVVIYSHVFLNDSADAEKHAKCCQIDGQCAHAGILNDPEICEFNFFF